MKQETKDKLRQMYKLGLLKKAKTVEEFEKLKTEIYNTIRPTSHSGDVDTISFLAYDMKRQLEEKNKSK